MYEVTWVDSYRFSSTYQREQWIYRGTWKFSMVTDGNQFVLVSWLRINFAITISILVQKACLFKFSPFVSFYLTTQNEQLELCSQFTTQLFLEKVTF